MRARLFILGLSFALLSVLGSPGVALAAPEKVAGGIRFTYRDANASKVAWAGAFNSWNGTAHPMTKDADGVWSVVIALPAGEQQYKFVVDGNWFADPENGVTAGDFGNSVVRVGPSGDLLASTSTSNTVYNPKILMGGRVIALYESTWDPNTYARYELKRPEMNFDLGFDIRMSDALAAHFLLNVNPSNEDVQDYRSRLNFKRGMLNLVQPGFQTRFFDSENVGTWDDPMHLVGNMGIYGHPFGYQRTGVEVRSHNFGFDTHLLYADNSQTLGLEFPGFSIDRGSPRTFSFEPSGPDRAAALLLTQRVTGGFSLVPGLVTKVQSRDVGDNDRSFGYGDGDKDVFALRIGRKLTDALTLGALARSDRGYGLGTMTLGQSTGDSTYSIQNGQAFEEWFGAGFEAKWAPREGLFVGAEYLSGAHRYVLTNGATSSDWKASSISSSAITAAQLASVPADGDHLTADRSARYLLQAGWSFAQGDIGLRAGLERQDHTYPAWAQEPITPAGAPPVDHPRFENVEFQRARYTDTSDLENHSTEWTLAWDRNWRHYLGRPVKSTLALTWTNFAYDSRTAWEHQLWFPTGNFWLESGQNLVTTERMTLLGEAQVVSIRPTIEYPIERRRNMTLVLSGDYAGVRLDQKPRYAETIARFGFDWSRPVRLQTDWRWAKYDAPSLHLDRGYLSQFTEAIYRFAPDVTVSLGFGVDPSVLDPNTNEFAYIGRDVFLQDLNANGFIAETDWLSLAPQLSAAEKRLQNTKRIQVKAIVRF